MFCLTNCNLYGAKTLHYYKEVNLVTYGSFIKHKHMKHIEVHTFQSQGPML
jgi:hypothetical protein